MAVPNVETSAITKDTTSGSFTNVTKPANIQDNDVVLIGMGLDGDAANPNMDSETGWTRIALVSQGSVETFVFAKRITDASSEPSTWRIDYTGTEKGVAIAVRISGVHTSGDFWEVGSGNTGSSTTITSLSFNTSNDDQLALAWHGADRNVITDGTSIGGTGWTKILSGSESSAIGAGLLAGEKDIATAGATGNATQTINTDQWAAIQVSVRSIEPVAPPFIANQGQIIG